MQQDNLSVDGYKKVVRFQDPGTGLDAIISVHSTALGPALGGCRMYPYASFDDGLTDVLRLSKGMSYKNALAGLPLGGGKSVIFGDPRKDKTEAHFKAFAEAVNAIGGDYYTAQDSGINKADLEIVGQHSKWVGGLREAGDPSPYTAYGVWRGVKAAVRHKLKTDDLNGVRVIVLGLGHVGMELARLLHEDGAKIIASDVDPKKIEEAKSRFGALGAHHQEAFAYEADVYAPCALGGAINPTTIGYLKAGIVAGAANNQLLTPEMGDVLREKGVLYAPDYVINAGGVISIGYEAASKWERDAVYARLDEIGATLGDIFAEADAQGASTHTVADAMAEAIIEGRRSAAA